MVKVQDMDWVRGLDMLEMSDKDLKLLWDLAERETVNRYTEINIDMSGITNHVNSEVDVDGLMKVMGRKLMEQLQCSADGLHY